jgi:hypothetical protein
MIFRMTSRSLGTAVLAAAFSATPVTAAGIVFTGSGTATTVATFPGGATGTVKTGDTLSFRIRFDPNGAPLISDQGPTTQVFAPAVSELTASVGGFTFVHNLAVPFPSGLILAKGFTFVPGQPASQPTLIQQFSFSGLPFNGNPFVAGDTVALNLTSFFLQDLGGAPPTLANLADPSLAIRNNFQLTFRSGGQNVGVVAGIFTGSFAAAVPEPGIWGLLIVGFGVVGGGMRSARARKQIALA